jgi:Spy/CpxP family protein refolding chaperone
VKKLIVLVLTLSAALAHADSPPPGPGGELAQYLYRPDLVLRHRQDIGLDDRQAKLLKELIQQAQSRFLDLQWDLQSEAGKLAELMRASRVDESAALAQVDRVLSQEREVKRAQLTLLIRIKNLLTPEQQERLTTLKGKSP